MTIVIVGLLVAVLILLWAIFVRLGDVRQSIDTEVNEVRELRLTSRARISRASMQSGATTDEQRLVRLGRASQARRIVVGGDNDSELNKQLTQQSAINKAMSGGEDDGDAS